MEKPIYSGRKIVTILGIIVIVVVAVALLMFYNGPRLDRVN